MPIKCFTCGTPAMRNYHYDAYYCPSCLVWIESKCGDPRCVMCFERPKYPKKENDDVQEVSKSD